jgi:hypothetical protein
MRYRAIVTLSNGKVKVSRWHYSEKQAETAGEKLAKYDYDAQIDIWDEDTWDMEKSPSNAGYDRQHIGLRGRR